MKKKKSRPLGESKGYCAAGLEPSITITKINCSYFDMNYASYFMEKEVDGFLFQIYIGIVGKLLNRRCMGI